MYEGRGICVSGKKGMRWRASQHACHLAFSSDCHKAHNAVAATFACPLRVFYLYYTYQQTKRALCSTIIEEHLRHVATVRQFRLGNTILMARQALTESQQVAHPVQFPSSIPTTEQIDSGAFSSADQKACLSR